MSISARIAGIEVGDHLEPVVMLALNVSPESFYKVSVKTSEDQLIETVIKALDEGASIIDIGGKSTAPYLDTWVPPAEESRRVTWAIRVLRENAGVKNPISVDTTRAIVAEAALNAGADIVNDVYGLSDPDMARVAAEYEAPLILGARVERPDGKDPVEAVLEALRDSIRKAVKAGVDEESIIIDPAIGFNRPKDRPWYWWDSTLIARLEELRVLGRPILIGVSRKSFIGEITGRRDPAERLPGSLAATAIAVYNGAHIVRSHDVRDAIDAVKMAFFVRKVGVYGFIP